MHLKILVMLMLALISLSSCGNTETKSEDTTEQRMIKELVNKSERIQFTDDAGFVSTPLKMYAINEFKAQDITNGIVTAPVVCLEDQKTYVVENYPEEMMINSETFDAYYNNKTAFSRKINIYNDYDYTSVSESINLTGLDNDIVYFCDLSVNRDGTYSLIGNKMNNTGYETMIYHYNIDGTLIKTEKIPISDTTYSMINNSFVYYLDNPIGQMTFLYDMYYTTPGQDMSVQIAENVVNYCKTKDVIYYMTKEYSNEYEIVYNLWHWDDTLKCSSLINDIQTDMNITSMAYDSDNNVVYMSYGGWIYSYNLMTDQSTRIAELASGIPEMSKCENEHILFSNGIHQMMVLDVSDNIDEVKASLPTLRICYNSAIPGAFKDQFADALMELAKQGVYINVEETYIEENSAEYSNTMAKKLLASDNDFDMFMVESTLPTLFNKNYCEDVSKYPQLNYYLNHLIDGGMELVNLMDQPSLVPINLRFSILKYTEDWLDLVPQDPVLLSELAEISNVDSDYYLFSATEDYTIILYWFPQIVSNYMEGIIDKETAIKDLQLLINLICKLNDEERIYIGDNEVNSYLKYTQYTGVRSEKLCMNIPKISDVYKRPIRGSYYAINPISENKELAALVLSYITESNIRNERSISGMAFAFEDVQMQNPLYCAEIADCVRLYNDDVIRLELIDGIQQIHSGNLKTEDLAVNIISKLSFEKNE